MTNTSFTLKQLTVVITLASGTFSNGTNQVTLAGLRTEVEIDKAGHPSKNTAKIKIFGMLENDMNKLTTVSFKALAVKKNFIQVLAGDVESGMSVAFQGEITGAFANYKTPPNLVFTIEAAEGYYPSIAPCAPKSYKGGVAVATIMQSLAKQIGCTFENSGVTTQIHSPYLTGSAMNQAAMLAAAANIEFGVDNGILFIAPRGAQRGATAVPLLSAETGMKECPTFDKKGIKVECLYNHGISLGGCVKVQSIVQVACGVWRVNGLKHHLQALHAGGKWLTSINASWVGE